MVAQGLTGIPASIVTGTLYEKTAASWTVAGNSASLVVNNV